MIEEGGKPQSDLARIGAGLSIARPVLGRRRGSANLMAVDDLHYDTGRDLNLVSWDRSTTPHWVHLPGLEPATNGL